MMCLLAWPGALAGGEEPPRAPRDLWQVARRTASNAQASLADRLAAIKVLGRMAESQDDVLQCLANLLVDISYGWIDPRTRYD